MTDESDPLDWFPHLRTWPDWTPSALWNGGLVPPAPRQVPARLAVNWEETPNGGAIAQPSPLWNRGNSHWMESLLPTPPSSGNGGLLGNLGAELDGPPWFNPGPELKSIMPWPAWMRPVAPEAMFTGGRVSWPQSVTAAASPTSGEHVRYAANPISEAAPSTSPPQEQPKPENEGAQISTAEDLLRTTPAALARGTTMALGGTGDARELARKGLDWALQKAEATPETAQRIKQALRSNPFIAALTLAPTSEQLQRGLEENVTGPLYQPQTQAGKYLNTGLEFVPGAIAGGPLAGGLRAIPGAALRYGFIPGLASEAAGQATEGTAAERWARAAAALGTGGLAAFTHPTAPRGAAVPERGASAPPRPAEPLTPPAIADDMPSAVLAEPKRVDVYTPQEGIPGRITEHLPGTRSQPYSWREGYTGDLWNHGDKDAFYQAARPGLVEDTNRVVGSYKNTGGEWEHHPTNVAKLQLELRPDGLDLTDRSKALVNLIEATRGVFGGQEMTGVHFMPPHAPDALKTSVDIPRNAPLSRDEVAKLSALADRHGFYTSDRGDGVSLMAKSIEEGGPRSSDAVSKLLEPEGALRRGISEILPDAAPQQTHIVPLMTDYSKRFAPPDRGLATRQWLQAVDAAHPEDLQAVLGFPPIRDIIARLHQADADLHNATGPTGQSIGAVRESLQHLRDTAQRSGSQDWISAVREAYKKNPGAFPAVLLPLVMGAGAYEAAPQKD